ncbi:TPA: Lar family restriction alleviation protein [Serratia marcescens]
MKTRATDLTPCPFCSGPPVTFLREVISGTPFGLPDERLSDDESDGLFIGAYVFCHECGAQGEEVEKVVYSEADVGELIDEARNAWVNRDARHLDLFESSKSASEADHLDKYFATEESCNQ